jgi:ACS family tartrate transporter-like MFS transporter
VGIEGGVGDASATARLGRRLIQRLVLPLALLTFVNAVDRVNLSFAGHAMAEDLGLSPTMFGLAVSAFFVAYLLFQYPHAVLLRTFGIRRWLLVTVLLWGVAGVLMSRVNSPAGLLGARFLLGAAEAGFAPGVTWFINRWLPPGARANAMATVLSAVPLSLVVCGPLCGWILGTDNPLGLAAWRWMFLVQSLPNFLLAIAAYFYFSDDVARSPWLSAPEQALLAPAAAPPPGESLPSALGDLRVWRCAITWLFVMTGSYALLFWLPQLVRQMDPGGSELRIGIVSALPQAGVVLGMVVNGRRSDRAGERRWHTGLPAIVGGVLLLIGGLLPPGWGAMAAIIGAGIGIGATQAVFWAVPASLGIGDGRVSVAAIAVISMFGTAGGIIGPVMIGVVRQATGSFAISLAALALLLVLAGCVIAPFNRRSV